MKFFFNLFVLLLLFFLPKLVSANIFHVSDYHTYGPLPIRTQNPLYLLFLNDSLDRASTLSKGDFSTSLETSFSNLFERQVRTVGIGMDLDMEIIRTAINFGYGVTDRYEVGLQIPFLSFSGGFLDAFIQNFHNFFGLPNAGREQVANGRFSYLVTQNGATLYQVDQSAFRLSDIVVTNKLRIFDETKFIPAISLKGLLKIPTGSRVEGTGSGQPDFGFSILAEKSYKRFHSYTLLGVVFLGNHSNLNPILRNGAFTFGQGFEFNIFEHLSVIAQISGVTSIFKGTGISNLSEPVLDLTIGFTGEVPLKKTFKKIRYLAAFTEDPTGTGPSVDFTLYFNVGIEY